MNLLYVALGGAVGASLRYLAGIGLTHWLGHGFPYGTLAVNVLGSLVMGLFVGLTAKLSIASESLHLFIAIGLLGGFTTFSSFSLDAVTLLQRGETVTAVLYMLGSILLCVGALVAGLLVMRSA